SLVGGTVLRATFLHHDYDAVDVAEPALRATLAARHDGVVVTLDAPRRVTRIALAAPKSGAARTLELYRMDGDAPGVEPTVEATRHAAVHHAPDAVASIGGGGASAAGGGVMLMMMMGAGAGAPGSTGGNRV